MILVKKIILAIFFLENVQNWNWSVLHYQASYSEILFVSYLVASCQ